MWYTTIPELETLVQKTPLSLGTLVVKVRALRRNCIATIFGKKSVVILGCSISKAQVQKISTHYSFPAAIAKLAPLCTQNSTLLGQPRHSELMSLPALTPVQQHCAQQQLPRSQLFKPFTQGRTVLQFANTAVSPSLSPLHIVLEVGRQV